MLPELNLDNENYEDILEEAKNRLVSIYPEWTDFNYHDPGVTLMELFALMKESQQFFLNQIGEENRKKYLKLLGMERRHKQAAKSLVCVETDREFSLLRSNKLAAGELCFETEGKKQLIGSDIALCMSVCDGRAVDFIDRGQLEFSNTMRFAPFGEQPEAENDCYLCFDAPLPVDTVLDLYVEPSTDYPVKRNPLGDGRFLPLVQLEFQYYGKDGWRALTEVVDETHGMLFDGFIHFCVDGAMQEMEQCGARGYFIRIVKKEGCYDIAPVLVRISMNICRVFQYDTKVEHTFLAPPKEEFLLDTQLSVTGSSEVYLCVDGVYEQAQMFEKEIIEETGEAHFRIADEKIKSAQKVLVVNRDWDYVPRRVAACANGFPCQEIMLEDTQVAYDSFALLIQDVTKTGAYRLWEKVEDFGQSKPEDMHYVFDSARGVVQFGDCIHGMAPEGEIVPVGYVRTMGSDGNVRQGKINRFLLAGAEDIVLSNICDGTGGREEETLADCFLRAKRVLKKPDCAVTARDYEEYVKRTPGLMIESCKALSVRDIRHFVKSVDESAVHLAIKPYGLSRTQKMNEGYYKNIKSYMEKYRQVGSSVELFLPEYVDVSVYVEVLVKPQYLNAKKRLYDAVTQYFSAFTNTFGSAVVYSALYGYIDRLEFVLGVRSLSLDARGNGVKRNRDGDILIAPNGVLVLDEVRCSFTLAE